MSAVLRTGIATDVLVTASAPGHQKPYLNRRSDMYFNHEELARSHAHERLEEAIRRERVHRLVVAHRAARRAEESVLRARRLLASVVVG